MLKHEPKFYSTDRESSSPDVLKLIFRFQSLSRTYGGSSEKNDTPEWLRYKMPAFFNVGDFSGQLLLVSQKLLLPDGNEAADFHLHIAQSQAPNSRLSVGKASGGDPYLELEFTSSQFKIFEDQLHLGFAPEFIETWIFAKNVASKDGKLTWKKSDFWINKGIAHEDEFEWEIVHWRIVGDCISDGEDCRKKIFRRAESLSQKMDNQINKIIKISEDCRLLIVAALILLLFNIIR